jgi:7,8-dihydropterin-6-yl-methyl-4-(beta-D-ribofuranosyl)aminobenzene 5'-phosphate synthase
MDQLVQLDRLDITVIVDNETDGLSRPCGCCGGPAAAADTAAQYTSEVSHLVAEVLAGRRDSIDFRDICFAGHGYSLLLEATAGGTCHRWERGSSHFLDTCC